MQGGNKPISVEDFESQNSNPQSRVSSSKKPLSTRSAQKGLDFTPAQQQAMNQSQEASIEQLPVSSRFAAETGAQLRQEEEDYGDEFRHGNSLMAPNANASGSRAASSQV